MRTLIVALAAGALLGSGVAEVQAQGNSGRARQEARGQQEQRAREQQARERERERLRAEREAEARRVTRDSRTSGPVYGTRPRTDDRYDPRDDRRRDDGPWYDPRDQRGQQGGWEIWDRDRRERNQGNGPAFCRAGGNGHPVFGRQWCRDKGWGNASGRDIWGDVILRQPRDRRYDQPVSRSVLQDILGAVVLGRMDGYNGSRLTSGQWINDGGAIALQLLAGRTPVARLYDLNRDGRVDRVMLRR